MIIIMKGRTLEKNPSSAQCVANVSCSQEVLPDTGKFIRVKEISSARSVEKLLDNQHISRGMNIHTLEKNYSNAHTVRRHALKMQTYKSIWEYM